MNPQLPQTKTLFNPLPEDFSVVMLDDDNKPRILTAPAMELSRYTGYQYDFMLKHLSYHIYYLRGPEKNWEDDLAKIRKEIESGGNTL